MNSNEYLLSYEDVINEVHQPPSENDYAINGFFKKITDLNSILIENESHLELMNPNKIPPKYIELKNVNKIFQFPEIYEKIKKKKLKVILHISLNISGNSILFNYIPLEYHKEGV